MTDSLTSKQKLSDALAEWDRWKGPVSHVDARAFTEVLTKRGEAIEGLIVAARALLADEPPALTKDIEEAFAVYRRFGLTDDWLVRQIQSHAVPPPASDELRLAAQALLAFGHCDPSEEDSAPYIAAWNRLDAALRAHETKPAVLYCIFEDCDQEQTHGPYCVGHHEQEVREAKR